MSKKIFHAILLTSFVALFTGLVVVMTSLYGYFSEQQGLQLRQELFLASQGVELGGQAYLEELESDAYRLTWIAQDGWVLYDTQASATEMENHGGREEIQEATETGEGSGSRMSATLMRRTAYYAKRLSDGTVLRISADQVTVLALLFWMSQALLLLIVIVAAVSWGLADKLARQIVKPINSLDLDAPLSNDIYEEISPLLRRIHHQNQQLAAQMKALRERSDELAQITDSMNEGLVLLNERAVVLHLNPAAQILFHAGKDSEGRDFLELDRSPEMDRTVQQALATGHGELQRTKDGREYQFDVSRIDSDGAVIGAVVLAFDVTEKAEAERSRREFTSNVSHELKTPLQSIIGSAELMENGMVASEDIPRFVGRIRTEAQRLVALIEDILHLSQMDEGVAMSWEKVELQVLAQEVCASLEPQAAAKAVSLTVSGGPAAVFGVCHLLHEMVYNLCDNAIKYNIEGGAVEVSVTREEQTAILTVRDTGIGIPQEYQSRVFERFFRVDKSRSKAIGGTGLGLAIVKHTAQFHNAEVKLSSKVGVGTTVQVIFQAANDSE